MITNEKYFFKNQSSVSTSGPLYNVNDGTLILQVDGNVSNLELLVLGNTDLIDDNFVTLKTINASNYNMSDKITSTGIYWIDINGIRKIKLNLNKITGSVSVKAITKRGLTTDLVARAMAANSASGGITLDDVEAITGELANLNTEDKSNLVNAINEVANKGSKTLTESTIKYADLEPGNIYYCPNMIHFDYSYGSVNSAGLAGSMLYVDKHPSYGKRVMFLTGNSTLDIITNKSNYSFILSNFVEKNNVLTKTNTTSYTPTSDYNPATKKYVDDQFTTVNNRTLYLEGTGFIFGDGLNTAENKQLLTDTINKNIGSYFNVIVRDSDSVLTWTYSFDTLPQTTSSYIVTLAPYYTMTVAKTTVYIGEMQINYTYDADKGLYNITQWAMTKRRQLSITDQNEYISGTKTFTTLPKTTVVPTTDDQFVNKKYVDDSINALPSSAGSTPIYNFAYDGAFFVSYNDINYVESTDEKNVNRASEIINDMYTNGFGTAIINFYNENSANTSSYMCTMQFGSIHNKSTSFTFMAFNKKEFLYTETYDFDNFKLGIEGTWTDDVFTADKITCQGIAIAFSGGIASVDYVNDQVGNINTILATLTTVSEVSK